VSIAAWVGYPAAFIVTMAIVVLVRWVGLMQRRVNDHAERIAYLEGKRDALDGRPDGEFS
jgi:hypothetical protein